MNKPAILAAAISTLLAGFQASAAELYWDGTGTSWGSTTSWSTDPAAPDVNPSGVPGAADLAFFNVSGVNGDQTVNLNGNQSALGLVVNSTGAVTLLGGDASRTLALGASGIVTNAGAGALTIGSSTAGQQVAISLLGSQTWANNSGEPSIAGITINNGVSLGAAGPATLTLGGDTGSTLFNLIGGVISDGAGTLSLTMSGGSLTRWAISGANTYTGVTTVTSGALRISHNLGLGSTAGGTQLTATGSLFLDNVTITGEALSLT